MEPAKKKLRQHETAEEDEEDEGSAIEAFRRYAELERTATAERERLALRSPPISAAQPVDEIDQDTPAAEGHSSAPATDAQKAWLPLPAELRLMILSHVPAFRLLGSMTVSKSFASDATAPELWRHFCVRGFARTFFACPKELFLRSWREQATTLLRSRNYVVFGPDCGSRYVTPNPYLDRAFVEIRESARGSVRARLHRPAVFARMIFEELIPDLETGPASLTRAVLRAGSSAVFRLPSHITSDSSDARPIVLERVVDRDDDSCGTMGDSGLATCSLKFPLDRGSASFSPTLELTVTYAKTNNRAITAVRRMTQRRPTCSPPLPFFWSRGRGPRLEVASSPRLLDQCQMFTIAARTKRSDPGLCHLYMSFGDGPSPLRPTCGLPEGLVYEFHVPPVDQIPGAVTLGPPAPRGRSVREVWDLLRPSPEHGELWKRTKSWRRAARKSALPVCTWEARSDDPLDTMATRSENDALCASVRGHKRIVVRLFPVVFCYPTPQRQALCWSLDEGERVVSSPYPDAVTTTIRWMVDAKRTRCMPGMFDDVQSVSQVPPEAGQNWSARVELISTISKIVTLRLLQPVMQECRLLAMQEHATRETAHRALVERTRVSATNASKLLPSPEDLERFAAFLSALPESKARHSIALIREDNAAIWDPSHHTPLGILVNYGNPHRPDTLFTTLVPSRIPCDVQRPTILEKGGPHGI